MPESTGLVYEVSHRIDPEIVDEFDQWLAAHVDEMLAVPGFESARIYSAQPGDDGQQIRVTHYVVAGETELQRYIDDSADVMRQSAVNRFGDRQSATRRVLRDVETVTRSLTPVEHCRNCSALVNGQYCGNCGQRATSRLISVWELVRDAFGDLFEFDSRLWRTLIPLVIRPGKLTNDYLQGRRVRYMPPFRTYLVLSISFFVIAFFDPREQLGILFEPEPDATETSDGLSDEDSIREEALSDLIDQEIVDPDDLGPAVIPPSPGDAGRGNGVNVTVNDGNCEFSDYDSNEMPAWIAKRLTEERLIAVCERVIADEGKAFFSRVLDNVPAALFILLPLMALVLKLLYPLSKRYYVEHLLFIVHFHAFFFLILILQFLFSRLASLSGLTGMLGGASVLAASLYIPVYLYRAMRRVYGQGHLITLCKFLVLIAAYFAGFSFIFFFVAAVAAFSI